MAYSKKWTRLRTLGAGGQGTAYLVSDGKSTGADPKTFANLFIAASNARRKEGPPDQKEKEALADIGKRFLEWIASDRKPEAQGLAVEKVAHRATANEDNQKTRRRLEIEIAALSAVSHQNLLRLIDSDLEELAFVTEYYPGGTLSEQSQFKGDALKSLLAIRPLIDGVAQLHNRGRIHRDIKPGNIFLAADGRLVLGDFGVVFFLDRERTRVTDTFEKVGTTDYMPGWVRRERIDEVRPSFDVFALGKVIYEMVAGRKLHLWYLDEPDFDLLKLFPGNSPEMRLLREMLVKCVCERERECLADASALLREVDRTILIMRRNGQQVRQGIDRLCGVCASGTYHPIGGHPANVGIEPRGSNRVELFSCSNCGHLQMFYFENGKLPPSWG